MYQETLGEKVAYRAIGLSKEFPELKWKAAAMLTASSAWHVLSHLRAIEGYPLPKEGPVIVTGNHRDRKDNREIWWAAASQAHRVLRPVVKMSLLEQGAHEPDDYLRKLGTLGAEDEYKKLNAEVLKGIGAVGVFRHAPDRPFLKQCRAILRNEEMLGVFLQETRNPDCKLRKLQQGAAKFAEMFPNAKVCPVAFGPKRTYIAKPFTLAEKEAEKGRKIGTGEFTIMIADMIIETGALPEEAQNDWWEKTKEEESVRLRAA